MNKERFDAFKHIIDDLCFIIKNDLIERKINYGLLFGAYNHYLENENGGNGYIFDLELPTDLKYIVDNNILPLAKIVEIGSTEEKTFRIKDIDGGYEIMTKENIIPLIVDALPQIVACAIMYAQRESAEHTPYKNLFEEYFVNKYEEFIKKV